MDTLHVTAMPTDTLLRWTSTRQRAIQAHTDANGGKTGTNGPRQPVVFDLTRSHEMAPFSFEVHDLHIIEELSYHRVELIPLVDVKVYSVVSYGKK